MKKSGHSTLGGISKENRPLSSEKPSGGKPYTPSSGLTKSNPLGASYDSRPRSGDNKNGATRSGGGKGSSGSAGGTRVKNVY